MKHPISMLATILILILIAPATAVGQAGARPTPTAAPAAFAAATAMASPPCGIETEGLPPNVAAMASSGPIVLTLQPNKRQTRVDVTYMIGVIGQTVPLKAKLTLKPEGAPVPNHTVFFRVDGQFVAAARTDGQGNAQVPYKIPDVYATRKVEAAYLGSETCAGSKSENSLGITKAPSQITLTSDQKSVRQGSTFILDGVITRTTDGKPLDAHAVTLALDGRPQNFAPQASPGKFRWLYHAEQAGNYTVKAQFPGDDVDGAATATFSLTVLPPLIPAELSWESVFGRVGEIKTLTAWVRRTDGLYAMDFLHNGIAGVKVNLSGGANLHALGSGITDDKGAARIAFTIEDPPGHYYTLASVDSQSSAQILYDIKRSSGNPELWVSRGMVKVRVFAPATVKVGGCFDVTVLVTRVGDGHPLASIDVSMIGPYDWVSTTGANGQTPVPPCLKVQRAGPARFDASSIATDLYLADTDSITVNVVP